MGHHEQIYGGKINKTTNAKVSLDASVDAIDDGNQSYGVEIFPLNNDTRWSACFSWYEE